MLWDVTENGHPSLHGTTQRICSRRLQESHLPPQQVTIWIETRGLAMEKKQLPEVLTKLNFMRMYSNALLYIYIHGDLRIIMPIFVDDMTLVSKLEQALEIFIMELGKHFKLCNLGPTNQLLGIKIDHDCLCHSISLFQHLLCPITLM